MIEFLQLKEDNKARLKVKLTVTSYATKTGFELKKSLYFYKKPNPEHLVDTFYELMTDLGPYSINNLHLLDDGIYELKLISGPVDYYSGVAEDWDYELIPWED